jgi:hypothetical protein
MTPNGLCSIIGPGLKRHHSRSTVCLPLLQPPRQSEVRKVFAKHYLLPWIYHPPEVEDYWDHCLQELDTFSAYLAFPLGSQVLFGFSTLFGFEDEFQLKIWDTGVLHDTLPYGEWYDDPEAIRRPLWDCLSDGNNLGPPDQSPLNRRWS